MTELALVATQPPRNWHQMADKIGGLARFMRALSPTSAQILSLTGGQVVFVTIGCTKFVTNQWTICTCHQAAYIFCHQPAHKLPLSPTGTQNLSVKWQAYCDCHHMADINCPGVGTIEPVSPHGEQTFEPTTLRRGFTCAKHHYVGRFICSISLAHLFEPTTICPSCKPGFVTRRGRFEIDI